MANNNLPPTKTCSKCGEKKDRSEFTAIHVCAACTNKELEGFKDKRERKAQLAKKDARELKRLKAQGTMRAQLALEAWTALRAKNTGECPYQMTCEHKGCLPDQREWCLKQEAFMFEPDAKRRERLIWDFVMSFQDLMKELIKRHVAYKKWLRHLEVDDMTCQMNMALARRFIKMMDEGTYGKKTNLGGYLSACVHGESMRLLEANGMFDFSLDGMAEYGFHGLENKRIA